MSGLTIKLRAGDVLLVNGAAIRFRTAGEVNLPQKADILFGKQVMLPGEANSPARRLYFAIQNAYITQGEERRQWLERADVLLAELREALTNPSIRAALDSIREALADQAFYPALRACLTVRDYERVLVGPPHARTPRKSRHSRKEDVS